MDRTVSIFDGFAQAERAEHAYYASLTPQQRVDLLLDMIYQYRESLGEAERRFERVHRIVELSQG